jgi:hypothetical protein
MFNSREAAKRDKYFKPNEANKNSMTLVYQEGTNYAGHKEDPEYFHVPNAARKAAEHYMGSLEEGEEPNPDAVRLFGLKKTQKGDWVHDRNRSQLANVNSLGKYLNVNVKNKTTGLKYKLAQGFATPTMVIGPDENGNMDYRAKRAGEYKNVKTGERLFASPLTAMGQSHIETVMRVNRLKRSGVTDPQQWRDEMKKANQTAHGVKSKDGSYEGLRPGGRTLDLHHHVNHTVNNLCEAHDATDNPDDQKLIEQGKTARFVKCFCPYCTLNKHANIANQIYDMQFHEEAARKTQDPKIRAAYFAGFPVSKDAGELGTVGRRAHHRVLEGTKAESTIIKHTILFRQDEDNHAAVVPPRARRRPTTGQTGQHINDPSVLQSRVHFADEEE